MPRLAPVGGKRRISVVEFHAELLWAAAAAGRGSEGVCFPSFFFSFLAALTNGCAGVQSDSSGPHFLDFFLFLFLEREVAEQRRLRLGLGPGLSAWASQPVAALPAATEELRVAEARRGGRG